MFKKTLATITATITVITMAMAPSVTAFANEGNLTDTLRVNNYSQETVVVVDSISVDGGNDAIYASGSEVEVTVNGDVSSESSYTSTYNGEVYTSAFPVVSASDEANVTINGDVNANGTDQIAVDTSSNAEVTVNGDVNATSSGISAANSTVSTGNITAKGSGVYADNSAVSTGDIKSDNTGVSANNNSNVSTGNITTTDGHTGVYASNNSKVNINGTVDASGVHVYTDDQGNEQYSGATGVHVTSGSSVNVSGDVVGGSTGASATDESKLVVEGKVVAIGTDQTYYTWNEETKAYDIPHKTSYGTGIYSDGDADILIKGDVLSTTTPISVSLDNDDKHESITVLGTIAASDEVYASISISNSDAEHGGFDFDDNEDVLDDVPEITVYAIDSKFPNPIYVGASVKGEDDKTYASGVYQAVKEAINYIIKQEDESNKNYGITVSGENVKHNDAINYDTVNVNKAFQVAAKSLPGEYTISAGENVSVVENSDGTYTLTLTNNRGGINIKAVLRPVTVTKTDDKGNVTEEVEYVAEVQSVSTPSYADPAKAPEGAIVIASTPAAAASAETAAISGTKPAITASFDLGKVTPMQFKNAIIENVAAAPASGAFNIETDRVSCFDSKMIQAFAARPDIDVNVVFTYGGKKLKVVIPAGYDVSKLLDENGYCGFLRLLALLGGTEL